MVVKQNQIRLQHFGATLGLPRVTGVAHHTELAAARKDRHQATAEQRMIINHKNADGSTPGHRWVTADRCIHA